MNTPKCDVCGKRTINRMRGTCWSCRKWFGNIKNNLWRENPKMWYSYRDRGLL